MRKLLQKLGRDPPEGKPKEAPRGLRLSSLSLPSPLHLFRRKDENGESGGPTASDPFTLLSPPKSGTGAGARWHLTHRTAKPATPTEDPEVELLVASPVLSVGGPLPAFRCVATDPSGRHRVPFDSAAPRGSFTVLCLFSAAEEWAFCAEAMAKMEELWALYRMEAGCQFLAVGLRQRADELYAFRLGFGAWLTVPLAPDPESIAFHLFGPMVPQFYLLDSNYNVVASSNRIDHPMLYAMTDLFEDAMGDAYSMETATASSSTGRSTCAADSQP